MTDEIPPRLNSQPLTPPIQTSYNEQSHLHSPDSAVSLATPQLPPPHRLHTSTDTHPVLHHGEVQEIVEPGTEAVKIEDEELKDQKAQDQNRSEISSLPPRLDHLLEPQDENVEAIGVEMTQTEDEPTMQVYPGVSPVAPVLPARDNVAVNPKVAELKIMFPDFDAIVLQSVLDSVNGNQERAIELLLGMSDPDYVPTPSTAAPEQPLDNHSLDVDEQLARQLAMEEEQVHRDGQAIRSYTAREEWQRRDAARLQAQAYAHAQNRAQYQEGYPNPNGTYPDQVYPQQGPPRRYESSTTEPRGDFVSDVSDTITSIAENGRKAFTSLFGKAKAKIDEYNARPAQRPQQYPQQAPYPNQPIGPVPSTSPPPRVKRYSKPPPPIQPPVVGAPLDRHAASEAYQAQYFGGPDSAAQLQSSGWEQAKSQWTRGVSPGGPSPNGAHDPIAVAASGPGLYTPTVPPLAPVTGVPGPHSPISGPTLRGYNVGTDLGYGMPAERSASLASTGSGANSASGGPNAGSTGNLSTSAAPPPATVHGFDVRELGYALPGEIPGSGSPTGAISPAPVRAQSPAGLPRGSMGDVPAPPRTSTGSPIDASRIGLLPKRAVSLLPPQSAASTTRSRREDDSSDDEELEYLENPFEDERR